MTFTYLVPTNKEEKKYDSILEIHFIIPLRSFFFLFIYVFAKYVQKLALEYLSLDLNNVDANLTGNLQKFQIEMLHRVFIFIQQSLIQNCDISKYLPNTYLFVQLVTWYITLYIRSQRMTVGTSGQILL
uniref:Uncharacterized protein n=1 Tax=Cacopsylla melanoneura TaxID=428564 RepID=A0A8D8TX81_9HEMI